MTQNFKAGDKVRVIEPAGRKLPLGAEFTLAFDQVGPYVDVGPIAGGVEWLASRFELMPAPGRFILVYPNGKTDAQVFDTEAAAAEAGEEAFDSFEVAKLVTVAKYTIETTTTLLREAA